VIHNIRFGKPRLNLTGKRFGRWVVLRFDGIRGSGSLRSRRSYWLCQCDCGNQKVVSGSHLTRGASTSCGCWYLENAANRNRVHGEASLKKQTPEYRCWHSMMNRCHNPNNAGWLRYGGRGITVCERWKAAYLNFLADVGRRPSPSHSLDRINVNGNYEPSNCRWATSEEQLSNRRPFGAITNFSTAELEQELLRRQHNGTGIPQQRQQSHENGNEKSRGGN
jgi:hypothetical protein